MNITPRKKIMPGVPQCSLLGPLCDLFFIIDKFDVANFVDDNTPYVTGNNISSVVTLLEEVACISYQWFKDN